MYNFTIDNFQVFRRFLLVEGWAYRLDGRQDLHIAPSQNGAALACQIEWSERLDVLTAYPEAPIRCGFCLQAILPASVDIMTLELLLTEQSGRDRQVIQKPWEAAVHNAYRPLEAINQRFFEAVRGASGARALEIGARARSGIVRRQMFGDAIDYVGFDIKEGENVDVVGDAHMLSEHFPARSFDFAYSVSVFEHLMWPWKVALELGRVMKTGGLILMQSHPVWPKHEVPWDFFRFWDSGWRGLFCEATGFEVLQTVEAHSVDLVSRPFSGSYVHHWDQPEAKLASSVLARKICEPTVTWSATPPLDSVGLYPG